MICIMSQEETTLCIISKLKLFNRNNFDMNNQTKFFSRNLLDYHQGNKYKLEA